MGDVARFRSIRQAISYCGLCGDEKSSADKVIRTPLSKQRNKHIQRVLVEAAKLAPREDHKLALVYATEKQKGNANRATLAVARKMVAYLLAVDRGRRNFVPAEEHTFCQGESNSSLRRRPGSIGTCQCQSLVVNLTALLIVSTEGELSVSVFSRTCRYTRTSCACRTGSVL